MRLAKPILESSKPNIKAVLLLPENPEVQEGEEVFGIKLLKSHAPQLADYDLVLSQVLSRYLEVEKPEPYHGNKGTVLRGDLESAITLTGGFSEVRAGTFRDFSWTNQVRIDNGEEAEDAQARISMINLGKVVEKVLRVFEEEKWVVPRSGEKLKGIYEDLIRATKKQMSEFLSVAKGMVIEERTGKYSTPLLEIRKASLGNKGMVSKYREHLGKVEALLTEALREVVEKTLERNRGPLERFWRIGKVHITIGEPPKMGEGEVLNIYLESEVLKVREGEYQLYMFLFPTFDELDLYWGDLERIRLDIVSLLGVNVELADNEDKLKGIIIQSKTSDLGRYAEDERYRGINAQLMVHPDTAREDTTLTRDINDTITSFYNENFIYKSYRYYWSAKYLGGDLISYEKSYSPNHGYISTVRTGFSRHLDRIGNVLAEAFPEALSGDNDQIKKRGFIQSHSTETCGAYDLLLITNSSLLHKVIEQIVEVVEREKGGATGIGGKVQLLGQGNVYASAMKYMEEIGLSPEEVLCFPREKEGKRGLGREGSTKNTLVDYLGWIPIISESMSRGQATFHLGSESLKRTEGEGYHQVEDPRKDQKERVIQLLIGIGGEDIEKMTENLTVSVKMNRMVEVVKRGEGKFEALPEKVAVLEANLGFIMKSERGMVLVVSI